MDVFCKLPVYISRSKKPLPGRVSDRGHVRDQVNEWVFESKKNCSPTSTIGPRLNNLNDKCSMFV